MDGILKKNFKKILGKRFNVYRHKITHQPPPPILANGVPTPDSKT